MRFVALALGSAILAVLVWLLLGNRESSSAHTLTSRARSTKAPASTSLDPEPFQPNREPVTEPASPTSDNPPDEWPTHLRRAGGIVLELVGADGTPRAGVTLRAQLELWRHLGHGHEDKYQEQVIVTDSAGRAPIAATHPDEIEFVALREDGRSDIMANGPFEAVPGTNGIVRLVFPSTITLRGRVVDTNGTPVESVARVELEAKNVEEEAPGLSRFTRSDEDLRTGEDGRFALEVVPGWYTLGAGRLGHDVFELATLHVSDEPNEHTVDLRVPVLSREVVVRVEPASTDVWVVARAEYSWPTVQNSALVVARRQSQLLFRADRASEETWLLKLAPGCDYLVTAGRKHNVEARAQLPANVDELTLVLEPKPPPEIVTLRGRATGASGESLRGTVFLLRASDLGRFAQGETNSNGEFEFELSRATHQERAAVVFGTFRDAGSALLGPVDIESSRDDLMLVVDPPLEIRGRVEGLDDEHGADVALRFTPSMFAGSELPASAAIFDRIPEGRFYRIRDEGTFRFRGLAAGEYELFVQPVSLRQPPARVAVRAGDRDVVVRLGDGLVGDVVFECLVIDALTRAPIPNAVIRVRGPSANGVIRGSNGRTDAEGRCELVGHAPGAWFLDVQELDHAHRPERFVEYGRGRHVVEIELSPRCSIDVEFVDAAGTPLAGIEVGVTTIDGVLLDLLDSYGNWDGCVTKTNVAGRARLTGLPMGPVQVVAGWMAGKPHSLETNANSARIEELQAFARFESVLTPDRRAILRQVLR